MRFERSALYAVEHGYPVFTSTLGTSRWKDLDQINECGMRAAARHDGLGYWTHNWRKKGGAQRMVEISKDEEFYQQEYCGCVYSLRDTNAHRVSQGAAAHQDRRAVLRPRLASASPVNFPVRPGSSPGR